MCIFWYGVATISRLLNIIGLFGRISSLLWGSFAKETYIFKEPTNHSHPRMCIVHPEEENWKLITEHKSNTYFRTQEMYRSLLQKSPIKETIFWLNTNLILIFEHKRCKHAFPKIFGRLEHWHECILIAKHKSITEWQTHVIYLSSNTGNLTPIAEHMRLTGNTDMS